MHTSDSPNVLWRPWRVTRWPPHYQLISTGQISRSLVSAYEPDHVLWAWSRDNMHLTVSWTHIRKCIAEMLNLRFRNNLSISFSQTGKVFFFIYKQSKLFFMTSLLQNQYRRTGTLERDSRRNWKQKAWVAGKWKRHIDHPRGHRRGF